MRNVLIAGAFGMALAACNEIPQDASKPYAGKEDTKAYAGDLFKGDKQKYEATLAERASYQNDFKYRDPANPQIKPDPNDLRYRNPANLQIKPK